MSNLWENWLTVAFYLRPPVLHVEDVIDCAPPLGLMSTLRTGGMETHTRVCDKMYPPGVYLYVRGWGGFVVGAGWESDPRVGGQSRAWFAVHGGGCSRLVGPAGAAASREAPPRLQGLP